MSNSNKEYLETVLGSAHHPGAPIYIDIKKGFWCCKRMMVLAKYHDSMDIWDGKISVYAPEDQKRLFTSQ